MKGLQSILTNTKTKLDALVIGQIDKRRKKWITNIFKKAEDLIEARNKCFSHLTALQFNILLLESSRHYLSKRGQSL